MTEFRDFPIESLMKLTARPELVFVRGEGSWLWDHAGKKYLDFVQGWAVNCLGHAPPTIAKALSQQASRLLSPSPAFYNDQAIQLAKLITDYSPFDRIFFANCGAEANEGAIKLARKWGKLHKGGAFEIITFANAFHGRTLATMSASGKPGWDTMFAPQVPGFPKACLNDLPSVEKLVHAKTVAIMLEPVQGEAGVFPATSAFLHGLREICDRENLLLICDEVQTGCGRLGTLWGFESFPGTRPLVPDIMTLGKGIGGGVPLAALCARESVSVFEPGEQGGTYNGNPLMCAVGLAVINEVRQPEFLKRVSAMGEYLANGLRELSTQLGLGEVRGKGLLLALELGRDIGAQVVVAAREDGLLLNSPRPACLRFMPALTVTQEEIDQMLQVLRRSIAKNQ